MAVDMKTHNVYLAVADWKPRRPDKRRRRRAAVPHAPESFPGRFSCSSSRVNDGDCRRPGFEGAPYRAASPGVPGKI